MSDDQAISDLLEIAGVSPSNGEARGWLEEALAGARTYPGAAAQRRPPSAHNRYLRNVERAADTLREALEQLRDYPHAHRDFWTNRGFGPVRCDQIERGGVFPMLEDIRVAAAAAKIAGTGAPPKRGKKNIVNMAFAFFARFSDHRPSADDANPFVVFAERFYEEATGERASIRYQIEQALKRAPIAASRKAALRSR